MRAIRSVVIPLLLLAACAEKPERAAASPDSAGDTTGASMAFGPVSVTPVNDGQHGMAAIPRWARSPDGRALLVVEDWSSVENEPYYDGFLLASEVTGTIVKVDSIWDVAPSPDWTRVAFGRAMIIVAGESDTLPERLLDSAARSLEVTTAEARRAQFPASGMVAAAGFARLGTAAVATGDERTLPLLAGWQVRWSADGTRIFAGRGPTRSSDDDPPSGWVAVDAASGAVIGPAEPAGATALEWTIGPTIDISVTPDTSRVELPIESGVIVSGGNMIRMRTGIQERVIGPGIALATTLRGCYIAALAPDSTAGEYDPKYELVVYSAGCCP